MERGAFKRFLNAPRCFPGCTGSANRLRKLPGGGRTTRQLTQPVRQVLAASCEGDYFFCFLLSSTLVLTSTGSALTVLATFSETFLASRPLGSQPAAMATILPP